MLIAQLTDLHVRPAGMPAYRVAETNMLTERALRAVATRQPAPDLVVITGDLTDCGLPEEYELLAGMLSRNLPMPFHVIPGNHDRRENLVAGIPGLALRDGFLQYVVEAGPVRLIMLDTVVPGAAHGELCRAGSGPPPGGPGRRWARWAAPGGGSLTPPGRRARRCRP